jgi:FAD synthetase
MYKKVLVGGCFDVIHIGHVKFLEKAKKLGDYLIVLLESDENIKKLKGKNRPIFKFKDRKYILESLKFVDKVIIIPSNPLHETYNKIVQDIKPHIIAVTEDDPIIERKLKQAKSVGAELIVIKKFNSYTSSKIINLLDI